MYQSTLLITYIEATFEAWGLVLHILKCWLLKQTMETFNYVVKQNWQWGHFCRSPCPTTMWLTALMGKNVARVDV